MVLGPVLPCTGAWVCRSRHQELETKKDGTVYLPYPRTGTGRMGSGREWFCIDGRSRTTATVPHRTSGEIAFCCPSVIEWKGSVVYLGRPSGITPLTDGVPRKHFYPTTLPERQYKEDLTVIRPDGKSVVSNSWSGPTHDSRPEPTGPGWCPEKTLYAGTNLK